MINQNFAKQHTERHSEVVIGLSTEKLLDLMRLGVLCGADIHAVDSASKRLVQQACLHACAEKVCRDCDFSDSCAVEWSMDCRRQCPKEVSSNLLNL
ncbi:hypothetical protein [Hydrogenovibrio kuenenii]|uniref:hypothetical protein n=1 Tax=Hydrogenovibrio kuenenii TaxID=63658 RepID=UPI00046647CC|nr:hypothetical protein [Hydrogenovibrio kuenenii]